MLKFYKIVCGRLDTHDLKLDEMNKKLSSFDLKLMFIF